MKKKIVIEVNTPDNLGVLPEEGDDEANYTEEELKMFRQNYSKDLQNAILSATKNFVDNYFTANFLDSEGEEVYIDGYDDWEDYNTTMTVTQEDVKNE